jgi:hypothetical protein
VVEKHGLAALQQLAEVQPRKQPGAEIEAVGERIVVPRQPGVHEAAEDHRIDEDEGQRLEDRPQAAEQRVHIAGAELARHHAPDETAVLPQRPRHEPRGERSCSDHRSPDRGLAP